MPGTRTSSSWKASRARKRSRQMRRSLRLIRKFVLAIIAAVVILAGVLLFNVVTHGSRQIQVAAVPRVQVDEQGAATRLAEAIRFQTVSNFLNPDADAEALRGLQAHIAGSFPAFHAAAKRETVATWSLLTRGRAPT